MQTNFSETALADPAIAASEAIIRKCVHCGFCTATCPTYTLLGDELDSPLGRIYLIKDMLENERQPTEKVVKHIDRCLSCLSCMTTCPSGVHYMHLVDQARAYIEDNYRRSWWDRTLRGVLAWVLPHHGRFRLALELGQLGRPFAGLFDMVKATKPLAAMLRLVPSRLPAPASLEAPGVPQRKGRVALLQGCAEPVLRPEIREATVRLLTRLGWEVVFARGEQCCGALVHHMGREEASLEAARRNVDAWMAEVENEGLDAVLITASGCGTTIKDYGYMLRHDPAYADRAARVSELALDISQFLDRIELPEGRAAGIRVAYHSACSLQHGQKVTADPQRLLAKAGFTVLTPRNAHLCCGSAGTYNILQPEIANELGLRKAVSLDETTPDVIAAGNIGCAVQISRWAGAPVVHTVQLLDWATGGPLPATLETSPPFKETTR